jgi:uncharacterized protein YcfJ
MRSSVIITGLVVVAMLMTGCATTSTKTREGAGIGAILGGVAGAVIDKDNPWRGGVVGAAAGAVIGGAIGSIRDQAAQEAAAEDRTVQYARTMDDGSQEVIRATPYGYTESGDYKLVRTQVIRNGVVVSEDVKRVPIY